MSTEDILAERGATHGWFPDHALVTQAICDLLFVPNDVLKMDRPKGDQGYDFVQTEGLHMIAHKLGRIVSGNPDEPDHWADIAGYARLVADHLERMAKKSDGEDDFLHSPCPECVECGAYEGEMHLPTCPTQHSPAVMAYRNCPECGAPEGEMHSPTCPTQHVEREV